MMHAVEYVAAFTTSPDGRGRPEAKLRSSRVRGIYFGITKPFQIADFNFPLIPQFVLRMRTSPQGEVSIERSQL